MSCSSPDRGRSGRGKVGIAAPGGRGWQGGEGLLPAASRPQTGGAWGGGGGGGRWKPGAGSGISAWVLGPRSPPKPPSPLAKIDERAVHSNSPSEPVTVVSFTTTAAEPLSHTSVTRVTPDALPW